MEKDGEIPVFDEATENLIDAAMATAAARAAAGAAGYREAVENMVRAAMALPGLHFTPTDEELIRCYLHKKVKKEAMIPLADMREANVSLHNPMTLAATLPNLGDREWYFFTPRDRKYSRGIRPDRGTDGGFWKATGADKKIMSLDGTQTIGYKKSLVFNLGEHTKGAHVKTNWIMYEYRLNQPPRPKQSENDMRLDDWVLCSIHDQPHQAQRVAVKRNRPAEVVHHVDVDVDVQEQYAQQPNSTSDVDIIQYLEQHLLINNNASISTSCSAEVEQCQQQLEQLLLTPPDNYSIPQPAGVGFDSLNWEDLFNMSGNQGHLEQHPSTSTSHHVEAGQYLEQQPLPTLHVPAVMEREQYRYLEQQQQPLPTLHVPAVMEQEQYRYLEQQQPLPTLHVPAVMEQEQYRYLEQQQQQPSLDVAEQEQYRYLEQQQQQPLPSLDVAEQEQYAYHDLPTTLDHVPVFMEQEQYAQQYIRYQQEYQYMEQHPLMPLINNNNASAIASAEQYEQDLGKILTPDNSIPQAAGVGFESCEDWIKDFFEPIDDIYMASSNQGQGTTSVPSAAYDEAEAAASAPFKPLPTPTPFN